MATQLAVRRAEKARISESHLIHGIVDTWNSTCVEVECVEIQSRGKPSHKILRLWKDPSVQWRVVESITFRVEDHGKLHCDGGVENSVSKVEDCGKNFY